MADTPTNPVVYPPILGVDAGSVTTAVVPWVVFNTLVLDSGATFGTGGGGGTPTVPTTGQIWPRGVAAVGGPKTPELPGFYRNGALTAPSIGTAKWYNDSGKNFSISYIRLSVGVAPTGASLICDVNKNGITIFATQSNRPTIPAGLLTAISSAPDINVWLPGEYLSVDIDQVGSTVAGADLQVQVVGA